ncbi:MAG: hypothetical protein ACREIA_13455 [Opitutaceae bacterium]
MLKSLEVKQQSTLDDEKGRIIIYPGARIKVKKVVRMKRILDDRWYRYLRASVEGYDKGDVLIPIIEELLSDGYFKEPASDSASRSAPADRSDAARLYGPRFSGFRFARRRLRFCCWRPALSDA